MKTVTFDETKYELMPIEAPAIKQQVAEEFSVKQVPDGWAFSAEGVGAFRHKETGEILYALVNCPQEGWEDVLIIPMRAPTHPVSANQPDSGKVPEGWKLVGYYHKAESDPFEDDFFFADAINGDCPSCHPCYIDSSVTVHPTPVEYRVPPGYALVPLRLTPAMLDILDQDDWQWEDMLAAAEAITEEQYNEIAATPTQPVSANQPDSGKVPPGYALVPVEITPEMEKAWMDAFNNQLGRRLNKNRRLKRHLSGKQDQSCETVAYRAMLAASPSAPIAEGDK